MEVIISLWQLPGDTKPGLPEHYTYTIVRCVLMVPPTSSCWLFVSNRLALSLLLLTTSVTILCWCNLCTVSYDVVDRCTLETFLLICDR